MIAETPHPPIRSRGARWFFSFPRGKHTCLCFSTQMVSSGNVGIVCFTSKIGADRFQAIFGGVHEGICYKPDEFSVSFWYFCHWGIHTTLALIQSSDLKIALLILVPIICRLVFSHQFGLPRGNWYIILVPWDKIRCTPRYLNAYLDIDFPAISHMEYFNVCVDIQSPAIFTTVWGPPVLQCLLEHAKEKSNY